MTVDQSLGWDGVAEQFMRARTDVGAALVCRWAKASLPAGASIIDVGCGSGVPIAHALVAEGFDVAGIDASPTLIVAFRRRFPDAIAACEAAQQSSFFGRTFDAAIAIGIMFLLSEEDQRALIPRVRNALKPDGRFLFTAPREACEWPDSLTGRQSRSLGAETYQRILAASGLILSACLRDEGDNIYFDAQIEP
jgi:2-polyprenyl-3-methyl-5-hydroxy-6-metoxy-1,4-benzoquinol methylase